LGLKVGGGTDAHRVMSYNPFVSLQWMVDGKTAAGVNAIALSRTFRLSSRTARLGEPIRDPGIPASEMFAAVAKLQRRAT
jgi:hypothetical protein